MSPALTLWTLDDIVLVSSAYAIAEAERNLDEPERRTRLYRLIQKVEISDEPSRDVTLPSKIRLPSKDAPILLAAIHSGCTYLLTGDRKHFGHLLGQHAGGVRILTVRDYLNVRGVG